MQLILQEIPGIFTLAIYKLVFNNELSSKQRLLWIKERKVIYILKKPNPSTPGDFRPLSVLKVYKIPARILARRRSLTLPSINGEHQHGFMAGKDIKEPSVLATHLIQDAQQSGQPLQLISLDIRKTSNRLSHAITSLSSLWNSGDTYPRSTKLCPHRLCLSRSQW
jgi:hypothetical protein